MARLICDHAKEIKHDWRCNNCRSIIEARQSEFQQETVKFWKFFERIENKMICLACNKYSSFNICDGWGQI